MITERVVNCVNDVLGRTDVAESMTVADLGVDDLDIMEIDVALEEEFGVELDDARFLAVQSVADMCSLVEELL
jgi:acyl carrier protein